MECREYNYVKTRDNKRTLLLSYFTTLLEEGNAVDFCFSLSEYLFSLSLYYSHFILPSPPFISIWSRKNRDTLCVSQSHYPPPLVLSILRFVCHFTRPPDKLPSPKNRFAARRRSFKRPIPIICLISDTEDERSYLLFLLLSGRGWRDDGWKILFLLLSSLPRSFLSTEGNPDFSNVFHQRTEAVYVTRGECELRLERASSPPLAPVGGKIVAQRFLFSTRGISDDSVEIYSHDMCNAIVTIIVTRDCSIQVGIGIRISRAISLLFRTEYGAIK